MTHHPVTVLEDGTRVYSNHTRYRPVPPEKRKYKVRKPDVPGAVMYNKEWFLPLQVLADIDRVLPETRPDTDAYDHAGSHPRCRCDVCGRPEADAWREKWWKERGVRFVPPAPGR